MHKLLKVGIIFLLCLSLGYPVAMSTAANPSDEDAVTKLVEDFGQSLKMVPILAPEEDVAESMRQHYGSFVVPSLLEEWIRCPLKAPGRVVSSPWPDRIEITAIRKVSDTYEVDGEIVEVTNTEVVARRQVTIVAEKIGQSWLIKTVLLLSPQQ